MQITTAQAHKILTETILELASECTPDETGSVPEEVQDQIHAIQRIAKHPEALRELFQGLREAHEQPQQTQLSLEGRSEKESASHIVDRLIDRGAQAGIVVSEEVRDKVSEIVKKNFPRLR